jgi:hypothetical protein
LLPVDPAGEKENEKRERRRQRVHRVSVPERSNRINAIRDPAPARFALTFWSHKPPALGSTRGFSSAPTRRSFRTGRAQRCGRSAGVAAKFKLDGVLAMDSLVSNILSAYVIAASLRDDRLSARGRGLDSSRSAALGRYRIIAVS